MQIWKWKKIASKKKYLLHHLPPPSCSKGKNTDQNRKSLENLVLACNRYQVSDRVAAAIASAVLKYYDIITDMDSSQVIDRSKIRRERAKYRKAIQKKEEEHFENVNSLYFDGKKDATLMVAECEGTFYKRWKLKITMWLWVNLGAAI